MAVSDICTLPDMGEAGIREFVKWYYLQLRKEALLIDDRANGGGNISSMVIKRLNETLLGFDYARTVATPATYRSLSVLSLAAIEMV